MYIVEKINEIEKEKLVISKIIYKDNITIFLQKYKNHMLAIQLPYLITKGLIEIYGKKKIILSLDTNNTKENLVYLELVNLEGKINSKIKEILSSRLNLNTRFLIFKSSIRNISDNKYTIKLNISDKKEPLIYNKKRELINFENNIIRDEKIKTLIDVNTLWYKDGIYGINWNILQLKTHLGFDLSN